MRTIETMATVNEDGVLTISMPPVVLPGTYAMVIVIDEAPIDNAIEDSTQLEGQSSEVPAQHVELSEASMSELEAAFDQTLLNISETKALGYNPTYFLRMVHELGGVETAHRLLAKEDPSAGLTTLWELGRLDLSLEAQVLKPEFSPLFSEQERQRARQRLADVHYTAPWD